LPTTFGTVHFVPGGGALPELTVRLTGAFAGLLVPPLGDCEITVSAGTVFEVFVVTFPTLQPALVIADEAALTFFPTTFGTLQGMG
jgi:hypothetical protein